MSTNNLEHNNLEHNNLEHINLNEVTDFTGDEQMEDYMADYRDDYQNIYDEVSQEMGDNFDDKEGYEYAERGNEMSSLFDSYMEDNDENLGDA